MVRDSVCDGCLALQSAVGTPLVKTWMPTVYATTAAIMRTTRLLATLTTQADRAARPRR
jgi:hypothetical protein